MKKHVAILVSIVILCLLASILTFSYLQMKKTVTTEHNISINVGESCHLYLSDIFLKAECNWNSSDAGVASVDADGTIIGQNAGATLVTCIVEQNQREYKFLFHVKVLG